MMQNGTEDALEASKFANKILVRSALMSATTSNFLGYQKISVIHRITKHRPSSCHQRHKQKSLLTIK